MKREKNPLTLHPERMSLEGPETFVPLGNPVRLTIRLAPGKLASDTIKVAELAGGEIISDSDANVVEDDGLFKTVIVIPTQLGAVDFEFQAAYADNAIVRQTMHLNVAPSVKGVKRFTIDSGLQTVNLTIGGREIDDKRLLEPTVTYASVKYTIRLHDCSRFPVTVAQNRDDPVVRVDEQCVVYGLREGTAIITANFDGLKDSVQVVVHSPEDAPPR